MAFGFLGELIGGVIDGLTATSERAIGYVRSLATRGSALAAQAVSTLFTGAVPEEQAVLSPNEIIRQIREGGFIVDSGKSRGVVDQFRSITDFAENFGRRPGSYRPLKLEIPQGVTKQSTTYAVTVQAKVSTGLLGEPKERFLTIGSNRILSPNEISSEVVDLFEGTSTYQDERVDEFVVVSYTRSAAP